MDIEDELRAAVRDHQNGLLDRAASVYERVRARDPANPAAWNLSGVVAHQRGDHLRATELIGRAVELSPRSAAFHTNLGEAYRALGQFAKAAECCENALAIEPDSPGAANNLGLILQALGRLDEAVARFRQAVRIAPGFAMAHNNLGGALRAVGDVEGALACFRRALQINHDLAEAHSNLGQLLLERYQKTQALVHLERAVQLRPGMPEAWNNLGNVLRELGRLEPARNAYGEALRLNPVLAITHNNVAQTLQEAGRLDDAIQWYQRGLTLDPTSARILANLASALQEKDDNQAALEHYHQALRLDPGHAEAQHGLGSVLHDQGRYDEAFRSYREAVRLRPDFVPALSSLGTILEEMGDFPAAEAALRRALQLDPEHSGSLAQLATMLRGKLAGNDLATLERLAASPDLTDSKRATVHFGLAQVFDSKGDYPSATEQLHRANALSLDQAVRRGKGYDPSEHESFVDDLIATCTTEFFDQTAGLGLDSTRLVFIVGLPRSGTTLTEQILASHSRVHGAGEQTFAGLAFRSLPQFLGTTESPVACLARLDGESIGKVAQAYLDRVEILNGDADRVADKMPDNYLHLGLLATLFPRAKFIHCRRDLRDVAVSCWMTNFRQIRWANDTDHIAARFLAYRRLIEHWARVLPVPVLDVHYEETVSDLEAVAKRLVAWCELDWEPACLKFHQGTRTVRTASVTQVRQPIYRHAVERWRNYEDHLNSLFARLQVGRNDNLSNLSR